ncbi:hypothetical protein J6590_082032 [Homalodisca vitripennis]|nr:hypothetical protein J6590_082032 [Homalodisca vitripennis]
MLEHNLYGPTELQYHLRQLQFEKRSINPKKLKTSRTFVLRFKYVSVRGDSYTRDIAGPVQTLTGSMTSVNGMCMPGARLLDVVSLDQTSPEPGPCCEMLIVGTNDMAVGEQRNIYRHLEEYIAAYQLTATIDNPIHDQTVLVNAFIEELAVRYNVWVLNFDGIGRRVFTKHGQHFSMRGKWLLAGMIKESLAAYSPSPPMTAGPIPTPLPPPWRVLSSITLPAVPAAALGESAARQEHITYTKAVIVPQFPTIIHLSPFLGIPLAVDEIN